MNRMNRRYPRSRRSLDHTLLTALNIIMTVGGATALYHWVTFADMDPGATTTATAAPHVDSAAEQHRGG